MVRPIIECKNCKKDKPHRAFGLCGTCYSNEWSKDKNYYKNSERRKKYQKEYYKVYFQINKEKYKQIHKKNFIKRRYNLELEVYDKLLREQNFKCKICETSIIEKEHIDHCHKTGRVRGILCSNCNVGIGMFKENIDLIKKVILYLEHNKTQ